MSEIKVKTEKNDNKITWNQIDSGKIQAKVRKVQYRIYKASKDGNIELVHWLQKKLVNSLAAKLVATHFKNNIFEVEFLP